MAHNIDTVDYNSYMNSSTTLLSSLEHLHQYGLLFVHSVPSSPNSVRAIAEKIGPLKETLYKSTWDDLLYVDDPPGLQILHCLQASTQGGESLFSDALRAVTRIRKSRPDLYATLESFPVTYHYRNNTRSHIEVTTWPHEALDYLPDVNPETLGPEPSIKAINWSPPFQAPFLLNIGNDVRRLPTKEDRTSTPDASQPMRQPDSEFRIYFDAIRHLKKELEAGDAVFERKLEPGTAVIFDNRRIVHARKAFRDRGGERWLRGAYVNADAFRSRLRVLKERMN
ncbi:MAG: hypothetical protein LQ343_000048 [Gyalolechia ehrenbergii]|nr:MAG: hypothetical protein LQ343_000048 [Gyalolechia ehrenbergii]